MKNCPKEWTHEDLHRTFESCGEIISAKVSINGDFESRGYGFVEFATVEAAAKAVNELNGKELKTQSEDGKAAPAEKDSARESGSSDSE